MDKSDSRHSVSADLDLIYNEGTPICLAAFLPRKYSISNRPCNALQGDSSLVLSSLLTCKTCIGWEPLTFAGHELQREAGQYSTRLLFDCCCGGM